MLVKKPRVVIAATSSGTGKTTIVTGLLAVLKNRYFNVQSFKIGPDYIDPGFHKLASGRSSHNLDSWLVPENLLPQVFLQETEGTDIAIIEGVMGLYDGGRNGVSSTASIAKCLDAPIILVVSCKSAGESIAATILGFLEYDKSANIQGVILNNLGSKSHGMLVREAVEKMGVKILGEIFKNDEISLPERHLGLTPIEEQVLQGKISKIKETIEQSLDIEAICELANSAPAMEEAKIKMAGTKYSVRIGVAMDEAFSFYYQTSLETLKEKGAQLLPFSPLHDTALPDADGFFFGGGFPEMFAEKLSENHSILAAIKTVAQKGVPIYAECGGFMYLSNSLIDFSGKNFNMVGLIPGISKMQNKLQTVGYVRVQALTENILTDKVESLQGHEFHFSTFEPEKSETFPWAFTFEKMRTGERYVGGYAKDNILASYLHMNFLGEQKAAAKFVEKCALYRKNRGVDKWRVK